MGPYTSTRHGHRRRPRTTCELIRRVEVLAAIDVGRDRREGARVQLRGAEVLAELAVVPHETDGQPVLQAPKSREGGSPRRADGWTAGNSVGTAERQGAIGGGGRKVSTRRVACFS